MISINATLFIQIINFLALVYVLNIIMFRPILKILTERNLHIEGEKKKLISLEEETAKLIEKCVSVESEARKTAAEYSYELRNEANSKAEGLFNEAREEILAIREESELEISKKIDEAQGSLEKQAEILSEEIIEKYTGRRFAHE
jgi:F-type H+-transporting ATPase subunit b